MRLFLIFLLLGALSGCCTKKYCHQDGLYLVLQQFSQQDIDSARFEVRSKGSASAPPVDTQRLVCSQADSGFTAIVSYRDVFMWDYKLVFPSIGQTYTITAIETQREGCNSCFPYRPKSDYYETFKSAKVNGVEQTGKLVIYR